DSAGAASGFAYLEDESGVVSAADVPLDLPLGEEAEATRDSGTSQGRPFRSLDVTFRTGNLVAGVTVVAYPAAGYANPELAEAEALAAVLASRLSTPPEPGTTIGSAVLRLHDSERPLTTYDDAYFRLAAVDVPLAEESKQDAGARIATYGRATDVYQLWQGIDAGTGAGFLFGVTLLRFPDAAAATTWVRDLSTLLDANPFYGDLSVQSAPEIGDQTAALAYAPGGGAAGDPHALLLAVRVGADVARVHLVPQGSVREVPEEALAELARAQSDCLRVLSCPGTFPVPSSLTTPVGVPDATPIASFDDGNWTRTERATRAVCAVAVVGRAPSQRVTERPSRDRLRLPLLTLTHG
ncbi:MAG TPA: hypothetical protein VKB09_05390, partial [Thermomicrobiales bacterium]|nr:hypothetical protein [Thermomicrobiales bacterium]